MAHSEHQAEDKPCLRQHPMIRSFGIPLSTGSSGSRTQSKLAITKLLQKLSANCADWVCKSILDGHHEQRRPPMPEPAISLARSNKK